MAVVVDRSDEDRFCTQSFDDHPDPLADDLVVRAEFVAHGDVRSLERVVDQQGDALARAQATSGNGGIAIRTSKLTNRRLDYLTGFAEADDSGPACCESVKDRGEAVSESLGASGVDVPPHDLVHPRTVPCGPDSRCQSRRE